MNKSLICLSAIAMGLTSINVANAANATGTLTVKATITNSCVLNTSATGTTSNAILDFGTLSSLASNVDADTTTTGGTAIKVLCNNTVPWTLAFEAGKNAQSTQRRMIGGRLATNTFLTTFSQILTVQQQLVLQQLHIAILVLVQHKQLTSMVVFLLAQLYQVQVAMLTL